MSARGSDAARTRGSLETLLQEFRRTLEEANGELLDEVRGDLQALRERVAAIEGEVRLARAESSALQAELSRLRAPTAVADQAPAPVPTPEQVAQAERAAEEIRTRHRDVFDLLQAGEEPSEVARRTNRPLGEVQLIMRLLKPRPSAGGTRRQSR